MFQTTNQFLVIFWLYAAKPLQAPKPGGLTSVAVISSFLQNGRDLVAKKFAVDTPQIRCRRNKIELLEFQLLISHIHVYSPNTWANTWVTLQLLLDFKPVLRYT